FFSSTRRHARSKRDWSSDVCSSDLILSLAKSALQAGGNQSLNHARYLHRAISKLEHAICEYLGVLDHEDLSVEDRQRLNDVVILDRKSVVYGERGELVCSQVR